MKRPSFFRTCASRFGLNTFSAAGFAVVALLMLTSLIGGDGRQGFKSSEYLFTDASHTGLTIMPASCEASPPFEHTKGECGGGGGPNVCPNGLNISAYPSCLCPAGQHQDGAICVDDVGNACPNGLDVSAYPSCTCPFGQHQVGSSCIVDSCTPQYSCQGSGILNSCTGDVVRCAGGQICANAQCVCPAGSQWDSSQNQCVASECPFGFQMVGGVCTKVNQCNLPATCADDANVLNQCTGETTSCVSSYGDGWYCSEGSCHRPAPPSATINAVPSLLPANHTTTVTWTSAGARSCAVVGTNGDGAGNSWTGRNGSQVSSPITVQTTFTLTCNGFDGSTITRKAVVNIIPNWQEQ